MFVVKLGNLYVSGYHKSLGSVEISAKKAELFVSEQEANDVAMEVGGKVHIVND